jgi:hypothetical protein
MPVPYVPPAGDLSPLEKYKERLLAWRECNPGTLCKIGGKQEILKRHHDATQYNPLYFDTSKAIVFPGTFTDSRQAAWLELMLMYFAYSLEIGISIRPAARPTTWPTSQVRLTAKPTLVAATWFLYTPTSQHKRDSSKCM